MGDVFNEQLVKRQGNIKDTLLRVGIVAGALLLFMVFSAFAGMNSIVNTLFPLITLGLVFGAYFLFTMLSIEYEYVYTNGELDIDKIINKSRRKRVFSVDVRAIEVMAHISDKEYEREFANLKKTMDFSSGTVGKNTYVAKVEYKNEMVKMIFEPNKKIQEAMMPVLTQRKFHINKNI